MEGLLPRIRQAGVADRSTPTNQQRSLRGAALDVAGGHQNDRSASCRRIDSDLERLALPFAPVRRPGDLVDDPHLKASGGLLDIALPNGKRAKVPALPITFNGVRAAPTRGIPTVGADTRSVLRDIDLTEVEIAELFGSNVIADRPIISEGRGADQEAPSAVTG